MEIERMNDAMFKLARPKLAGVPISIQNGVAKLQSEETVPNLMTRDILAGLPSFVGELVVGPPEADDCYEVTMDFLSQERAVRLWVLWVYDMRTTENYSLQSRLQIAETMMGACGPTVQFVDHETISSGKELEAYHAKITAQGFKGVILREPYGTFGTYDEEYPPAPGARRGRSGIYSRGISHRR